MTTFVELGEVHPDEFVTMKEYVPVERPLIVVLVPVPVIVPPPGVLVKVHVPVDGNPFKITAPVAIVQFGCVTAPTDGAEGVGGCALMTTFADGTEIHPESLATV